MDRVAVIKQAQEVVAGARKLLQEDRARRASDADLHLLMRVFGTRLLGFLGGGEAEEARGLWQAVVASAGRDEQRRLLDSSVRFIEAAMDRVGAGDAAWLSAFRDPEAGGVSLFQLSQLVRVVDRMPVPASALECEAFAAAVADEVIDPDGAVRAVEGKAYYSGAVINGILAGVTGLAELAPESVYDPACGVCGSLVEAVKTLREQEGQPDPVVYGQDTHEGALFLGAWRLLLNGVNCFSLQHGDTLADPKFIDSQGSRVQQFDLLVSSPPLLARSGGELTGDRYGRFLYSGGARSAQDWFFVEHALASIAPGGAAALVVSLSLLTRSKDAPIRTNLVEDDRVSCVIQLPGGMLEDTPVPTAVMVLEAVKPGGREDLTWMVDATDVRDAPLLPADEAGWVWADGTRAPARQVSAEEIAERAFSLLPQLHIPPGDLRKDLPGLPELKAQAEEAQQELQENLARFRQAMEELEKMQLQS